MSDANRVQVSMVREATIGDIPSSPSFKVLRITSAPRLGVLPKTVVSNELRSDRQIAGLILVDKEAGGEVDYEISFASQQELIESVLLSDWVGQGIQQNEESDTPISDVTFYAEPSPGKAIFTCLSASNNFHNYFLGHTKGFTNSGNNGSIFSSVSIADGGLFTGVSLVGNTKVTLSGSTFVDESTVPTKATLREIGFQGPAGDITASSSGGVYYIGSTLVDFTDFEINKGDWIYIGGSAAANHFAGFSPGFARVSASVDVTATKIYLDIVPENFDTDTGAGKEIQIFLGSTITEGVTQIGNTIELKFLDHDPVSYIHLTGMEANTFNMEVASASIVTGKISFMGRSGSTQEVAISGSTYDNSNFEIGVTDVLNASSHVNQVLIGEAEVAAPNYVTRINIEGKNDLRRKTKVGSIGAVGMGVGNASFTGTVSMHFGNLDYYAEVMANTETSLMICFVDDDGHGLLIDIPSMKWADGYPDISGINTDVMIELAFQAFMHADLQYSIKFQQFHYLPI